jgi:hypothetical protein
MGYINIANTIDIILKIFGLRGWINGNYNKSNILKQVIIEVDEEDNVDEKYVYKNDFLYKIRFIEKPANYIYFVMIMFILIADPIFNIVISILYNDIRYVSGNIFSFLYLIQYIFGLSYFSSFHYKRITKRNEKYQKLILAAIVIFLILAFILSSLVFVLLPLNINIVSYYLTYSAITNVYLKVLFLIGIFISKFISYSILFINIVTFASIFILQSHDINKYSNKLEKIIKSNGSKFSIESITREYTEKKEYHSLCIEKLNLQFSSITIAGVLSGYFAAVNAANGFTGTYNYINLACFLLSEILYIYAITKVKNNVSKITDIIGSEKFNDKFLKRTYLESIEMANTMISEASEQDNNKDSLKRIKEITLRNLILSVENGRGVDWNILTTKLKYQWSNFTILGFEVDDSKRIQQCIAIIGGFVMVSGLKTRFGF